MNAWTTTLTAAEAIAMGACDGRCMVASKDVCDCVCAGAYHGVLAGSAIGEVTHTVRPAKAARKAPRRTVRRHVPNGHDTHAAAVVAAEAGLEMRLGGATYQEIADELGVSRSTVSKRIREYVGGAS